MDIKSCLKFTNTVLLILFSGFADATDSFTSSQSVGDGRTLVSRDEIFELGFFSPGNSKNRYLGIWYKKIPIQTVVWVANRSNPINDTTGLLMINRKGNLVLLSRSNGVVWYTNIKKGARNPVVQLLDTGNLVIRSGNDSSSETLLWQSFDYPTDTLLPGMKLGWDLRTGLNRRLSAWKNSDDPSPGDFTAGVELYQYPDVVGRKGSHKYVRTGPWNGLRFSGSPTLRPNSLFEDVFVWNEQEAYQLYNVKNRSVISRSVLDQNAYQCQHYIWMEKARSWMMVSYIPRDICDTYDRCGPYGSCVNTETPPCQCLKGFKPKSSQNLYIMDLNPGCERNKLLNCEKGDVFIKYAGLKVPDTTNTWVNRSMSVKECRARCLQNCSCMAYTPTDIRGDGNGCALWFGDLIDIKQVQDGGQDLYIRMSASELVLKGVNYKIEIAVIIPIAIFILAGLLLVSCHIRRSRATLKGVRGNNVIDDRSIEGQREDSEVELFDLALIAKATNDFSTDNKLGEGGFGPVYRGTWSDGQEIAVKRLSRSSGQGLTEFKNEVALIAKLQHRNLVKLLGCCIQGEEKLLVYEYMPNKSLDFFIFDKARSRLLDWPKRFNIICGVARGLIYLHQDSRLRIIHRDLKASNVLLDNEMNPKISDFGLARSFGGDQFEGNTNRVVGTYGYMAPEYAIDGQFSVKSDVFSFGILVLEIISGMKNRGFYNPGRGLNLIGHAWEMWKEEKPLELLDPVLGESCNVSEVARSIHIGLLCVQQHPDDRPNMSTVVLMLGSDTAMVEPKQPGFLMERKSPETDSSLSKLDSSSNNNEISMSILDGR